MGRSSRASRHRAGRPAADSDRPNRRARMSLALEGIRSSSWPLTEAWNNLASRAWTFGRKNSREAAVGRMIPRLYIETPLCAGRGRRSRCRAQPLSARRAAPRGRCDACCCSTAATANGRAGIERLAKSRRAHCAAPTDAPASRHRPISGWSSRPSRATASIILAEKATELGCSLPLADLHPAHDGRPGECRAIARQCHRGGRADASASIFPTYARPAKLGELLASWSPARRLIVCAEFGRGRAHRRSAARHAGECALCGHERAGGRLCAIRA